MAAKAKKYTLASSQDVDVVATLGDRIRVKTMTLNEAQHTFRKPSKWRLQLFQIGYHSYKATE